MGPAREVTCCLPQSHEAVVQEGPSNHSNFCIHGWTFHVCGIDMRLTMHVNDSSSVKQAVTSELEKIVYGALQQCHHAGLDYSFCSCFNPIGPHAVTLDEFI